MKTLIQLILIGLVIMCFSRCYNSKKATDQINKANDKFPEIVAKLARDKYPCTVLLKNDTTTVYEDSLVFIDCPDSNYSAGDYAIVRRDTIRVKGETNTVRVPVKILIPSKIVTQYFEDSAKLKLASIEQNKLITANQKLQSLNDTLSGKLKTRTKYLWWLLALCIGLTAWNFRKLIL